MKMRRLLCSLGLILLSSGAFAITDADIDNVTRLYCRGEYGKCLSALTAIGNDAIAKNPRLLCLYGDLYRYGLVNDTVNLALAKQYYKRAAQGGDPVAKASLGQLAAVSKSESDAMYDEICRGLTIRYSTGDEYAGVCLAAILRAKGKAHDPKLAVEILERYAATNPNAQVNLAEMYLDESSGVAKNFDRGFELAENAGRRGLYTGWLALAAFRFMQGDSDKGEKFMKAIRPKVESAAKQGDSRAAQALAVFAAYNVYHIPFSRTTATYMRDFIDCGNPPPRVYLIVGNCYQLGNYFEKDMAKAIKYYQIAADANESVAQLYMAQLYEEEKIPGVSGRKSMSLARSWYRKSAENGDETAQWRMVNIYIRPELGAAQDIEVVKKWLRELVKNGDENAKNVMDKILRKEAKDGL